MSTIIKNTICKNTKCSPATMADYGLPQAIMFLYPDALNSLSLRAGQYIEQIDDLSGNGNYGQSVSETNQLEWVDNQINGKAVMRAYNTSDILNFPTKPFPPGDGKYTLITVIKASSINRPSEVIISGGSVLATNKSLLCYLAGSVFRTDWYNNILDGTTTLNTSDYWMVASEYDGTNRNSYTNGVLDATDVPGARDGFSSAAQNLRGNTGTTDFALFLLYDKALNSTEWGQVNKFIKQKFGI